MSQAPFHIVFGQIVPNRIGRIDAALLEIAADLQKVDDEIEKTKAKIDDAVRAKKRGTADGLAKKLSGLNGARGRLIGEQRRAHAQLERDLDYLAGAIPEAEAERDGCTRRGKTNWAIGWQEKIDRAVELLQSHVAPSKPGNVTLVADEFGNVQVA